MQTRDSTAWRVNFSVALRSRQMTGFGGGAEPDKSELRLNAIPLCRTFSGEAFSLLLSACRHRSMHEACSPNVARFSAQRESWLDHAKHRNAPMMYGTQVARERYSYAPSPCECCWYAPCSDGPRTHGLPREKRCRLTWRQLRPCPKIGPAAKSLRWPDAHDFPKREASGPYRRNAGAQLARAWPRYDVPDLQLLLPGSHGRGRRPRHH